ncbi:hypothetical protein HDU97_001386 [Phlyctochytrium planicorne]|nr:hypothetical protein HDU97_001386 [Phlyctochytrium planicorne]
MQDPEKQVHLDQAIDFVGECLDMCPEYERHEREEQHALAEFEKKTLDYLFHNVLRAHGLEASYSFVRDRARSIRTDFTLQNYRKMEAVECHERIARYHILCAFKFCCHPTISLQQEQEQMRKTLQSLREYYRDLAGQGIYSPNEAEFQAYYILSHLWQNEIVTSAETQLRPEVFDDPYVQLAIELQQLAQCGTDTHKAGMAGSLNFYSRFFRLVESENVTYLMACLLHQEFIPIRRAALRAMHKGYYNLAPHFPLADLVGPLGCDDEEEVRYNLAYYGISCENRNGVWVGMIGKQPRKDGVKKQVFNDNQKQSLQPRISYRIVESKAEGVDIIDVIDGSDIGPPKPVPSATFDDYTVPLQPWMEVIHSDSTVAYGQPSIAAVPPSQKFPTPAPPERKASESKSPLGVLPTIFAKPIEMVSNILTGFKPPVDQASVLPTTPTPFQPSVTTAAEITAAISATPMPPQAPKRTFSFNLSKPSPSDASGATPKPTDLFFGNATSSSASFTFSTPKPSGGSGLGIAPVTSFSDLKKYGSFTGNMVNEPEEETLESGSVAPLPKTQSESLANVSTATPLKVTTQRTPSFLLSPKVVLTPRTEDLHKESDSFYENFLAEEISMVAISVLIEDASIRFIAEKLYDDVLEESIINLADEAFSELLYEYQEMEDGAVAHDAVFRKAKAFQKWKKNAIRRATAKQAEMERKQAKAVRFYLNVLASDYGSASVRTPQRISKALGRNAVNRYVDNAWTFNSFDDFEGAMLKNMKESTEKYESYFRTVDVTHIAHEPLFRVYKTARSPRFRHILWKLVVSTPFDVSGKPRGSQLSARQHQDKFACMWTRSKFGLDPDALVLTADGGKEATIETLLKKSVEGFFGDSGSPREKSRLTCLVQHVLSEPNWEDEDEELLEKTKSGRKQNSDCLCSGTNAVLFQMSLFDATDSEHWWQIERRRLLSLLHHLPARSRVALLIVYWNNHELEVDDLGSEMAERLDLMSLLTQYGGPVFALDFRVINAGGIGGSSFDHGSAVEVFSEGLEWLAIMTQVDPVLGSDIVTDVVQKSTADMVRFALDKVDSAVPGPDFGTVYDASSPLDMDAIITTWNVIADIFNLQIDAIAKILTSQDNVGCPFPAKEFSEGNTGDLPTPPILWNAETTITALGPILNKFRLPPMESLERGEEEEVFGTGNPMQRIRKLFEEYTAKVCNDFGLGRDQSSLSGAALHTTLTSAVWSRLASFERSLSIRRWDGDGTGDAGKSSIKFPFSRLGLAFASAAMSALEETLGRLILEIGESSGWLAIGRGLARSGSGIRNDGTEGRRGGPLVSKFKSTWYLRDLVDEHVAGFSSLVNETVLRWETEVVGDWVAEKERRREEKMMEMPQYDEYGEDEEWQGDDDGEENGATGWDEDAVSEQEFFTPGSRSSISFSTPFTNQSRKRMLSSSPTRSPLSAARSSYSTPATSRSIFRTPHNGPASTSKSLRHSATPSSSTHRSATVSSKHALVSSSWSSVSSPVRKRPHEPASETERDEEDDDGPLARLKRRLNEAIRSSKEEIEICKRRLEEDQEDEGLEGVGGVARFLRDDSRLSVANSWR